MVLIQVWMFVLFLLLAWPLFVTYCVHLHAYILPSSEVQLSKQSVSPSTPRVTHGLLSLQRVTCFSISPALKNTLISRCSCASSLHSSSWAGSVERQHHANVASVKAVDQKELDGISSWISDRIVHACWILWCRLSGLCLRLVTQHIAHNVLFKALKTFFRSTWATSRSLEWIVIISFFFFFWEADQMQIDVLSRYFFVMFQTKMS